VRVAVNATSVNPYDWKLRSGILDGMVFVSFPMIPGLDATGVVDEVGDGVEGVSVGDRVARLGSATAAKFAVLDAFALVPQALTCTGYPNRLMEPCELDQPLRQHLTPHPRLRNPTRLDRRGRTSSQRRRPRSRWPGEYFGLLGSGVG
jgi:hypothetical protein